MNAQSFDQLRERFLHEQQVSLNELLDVENPGAAAAELVAQSEHSLGPITGDERDARPATPAA